jgi:hypothetical protein
MTRSISRISSWFLESRRRDVLVALALAVGVAIVIWPAPKHRAAATKEDAGPRTVVGYVVSVNEHHLQVVSADGRELHQIDIPRTTLLDVDINHMQQHIGLSIPTTITYTTVDGTEQLKNAADADATTPAEQARASQQPWPLTDEQYSWVKPGMSAPEAVAIIGYPKSYTPEDPKTHELCGYWAHADGPKGHWFRICIDNVSGDITTKARDVDLPRSARR